MRVLLDHQIFIGQRFGGISRYFAKLLECLDCTDTTAFRSRTLYLEGGNKFSIESVANESASGFDEIIQLGRRGVKGIARRLRKVAGGVLPIRERFESPDFSNSRRLIEGGNYDLFHPTYYDDYFLQYLDGKPFVLTVFDMIHELYPEHFSPRDPTSYRKRRLTDRASRIIAISDTTKNDLVELFDVDQQKISVVPLATDIGRITAPNDSKSTEYGAYILYVGNRRTYKNFYLFVRSVIPLLVKDPDLRLVCTGTPFSEEELLYFHRLGVRKSVVHVFASEDQLSALYRGARAFVFPSLYEGFGIPMLEAFATGCPVAASDTPSLRETGGSAAYYFNPKKVSQISNAVYSVVYDDRLRSSLIAAGFQRLKNFNWNRTAKETLAVYTDAVRS